MNFIHMKYSQYIDNDLHSYVHLLTNRFNSTNYNIIYWFIPYISPKKSFYKINIQPHFHISWGKHEALYLANHVVICSEFMKQSCFPKYHILCRMFSSLYESHMSIYQSYISLMPVLYHLTKFGFMRFITWQ